MTEIIASGPARIILFGEYGVVFGVPAILASVDLRTVIRLSIVQGDRFIHLKLFGLNIKVTLPFTNKSLETTLKNQVEISQTFKVIKTIFEALSQAAQKDTSELCLEVVQSPTLDSGFGVSSVLCATLSSAFLAYDYLLQKKNPLTSLNRLTDAFASEVLILANKCEKIFHSDALGMDTAVCVHGGIVSYTKNGSIVKIANDLPLQLGVVNSKITAELLDVQVEVSKLRTRLGEIVDKIIVDMKKVNAQAIAVLKALKKKGDFNSLFELVKMNQGLLFALGITHPVLERIGIALADLGVAFKLTGVGTGANGLLFFNRDISEQKVKEALKRHSLNLTMYKDVGVEGLFLEIYKKRE